MNPPSPTASDARSAPASVWQTVRRFPAPVRLLFVGTFINKFGTFVVPFLALHLTRLGYSAAEAGLCVGVYGAGHVVASMFGGHLADTFGRRRTIMLSMFSGAVCMLALSQAERPAWVMGLAFLVGMAGECYKPASSALLADLVPDPDRVTAYAAYRFAINAGWSMGPAVAGLLARHSYVWLFVGDALSSALFGALAWAFLPREARRPGPGIGWGLVPDAVRGVTDAVRVAAGDRAFLRLLVASLGTALVFMQALSTLGLTVKAAGYDATRYGLVLALNGVVVVLFELPLSAYTRRVRPRAAIAAGFALIGVGSTCYAWATAPWHFGLGMIVFTLGEILSMPVALAYAARLAPTPMRGRYLGLYSVTWALAIALGPALGMAWFAWQPVAMWLGTGALGVAAGALMLGGSADRVARAPGVGAVEPA